MPPRQPTLRRSVTYRRCARLIVLVALTLAGCTPRSTPQIARDANADPATRTLVLISLDGFRHDYVDWPEASNLRALAARGVRADGLVPPFPSKTFPSHYTIVTGLTPGHHGLISNNMRDAALGTFSLGDRASVEDTRWWGGEPIWVTASKHGLATAAMFWPGTETEIAGRRPDAWHRWDGSVPYAERVAQVLAWLDGTERVGDGERPRLITLYFQDPNDTAHEYGPEASETRSAVREVDRHLGDLVDGIAQRGLEDAVDLMVVSDHGMAEVVPERIIILDQYVQFEPGELFEYGAFLQIFPRPGREDMIHAALQGAHPDLTIYRRDEIPARYGMGNSNRVAPIIGTPSVGWEALPTADTTYALRGNHGQDPRDPRMHGIFVAAGPSFVRQRSTRGAHRDERRLGLVESVDLYNLMAAVLGVSPAPNDGRAGGLLHVLDSPPDSADEGIQR